MNVARTADPVAVPLRQEARGMTLLPGDFLCGVFRNRVVIRAQKRVGVLDVKLSLTRFRLAFGVLNGHTSGKEVIA